MIRLVKYVLLDVLQSRFVIAYALLLLAASFGLFSLNNDPSKGLASLLNVVLIVTPLVSVIFAAIHLYNAYEFIELLAAQPLPRRQIILSQYLGLSLALLLASGIGLGLPLLMYAPDGRGALLLLAATFLTLIFIALALMSSIAIRDKARGIGMALLLWLYFALLFDSLVLMLMFSFADYPLDKAMLILSALNPIDLGRILVMLKLDASALMGYTGALFRAFFGTGLGMASALGVLALWAALPLWAALRLFQRKDF